MSYVNNVNEPQPTPWRSSAVWIAALAFLTLLVNTGMTLWNSYHTAKNSEKITAVQDEVKSEAVRSQAHQEANGRKIDDVHQEVKSVRKTVMANKEEIP